MDKEITTSIKDKKKGVDSGGELELTIGYTIRRSSGKTNEIDHLHKECYAKKTTLRTQDEVKRYKYYVKTSSDGSIFDPWGMYSEGTESKYNNEQGRSKWVFGEVNESCFNFYIKFLESRNNSWLMNAKREVR